MFAPKAVSLPGKRERRVAAMPHLASGLVWGTLLFIAGTVLVLDALGLEIVSVAFWGLVMLVVGALLLRRALGGRSSSLKNDPCHLKPIYEGSGGSEIKVGRCQQLLP
jgi:uncharacterized membrane protein HdeD (DUF308 family)